MSETSKSILSGAKEALEYAKNNKKNGYKEHKVKVPEKINVKSIREALKMTRDEFANNFGFKTRTLEKWEREERVPTGATRAYLLLISRKPKFVKETLKLGNM